MKYLCQIYLNEKEMGALSEQATDALNAEHHEFDDALVEIHLDDPVAQRVDDLDVLGVLARQGVRFQAHRGHPACFPVQGDGGWLFDDEPAASDTDERIDRAEVDRHARPQSHNTCL